MVLSCNTRSSLPAFLMAFPLFHREITYHHFMFNFSNTLFNRTGKCARLMTNISLSNNVSGKPAQFKATNAPDGGYSSDAAFWRRLLYHNCFTINKDIGTGICDIKDHFSSCCICGLRPISTGPFSCCRSPVIADFLKPIAVFLPLWQYTQ